MSPWHRRHMALGHSEQPPETVADIYARLLEAPPHSPLAHALAYTIGMHPDKPQAVAFGKMMGAAPESFMRWAGIVALAKLHKDGLREAERGLLQLVGDPLPAVRAAIAHELHCDSSPESAQILRILAADPEPKVRMEAAGGLFFCQDPASRETLLELTRDPEDLVRAEATCSLGWIDGTPLDIRDFLDLLDDPCPEVRGNMTGWLGWIADDFTYPYLLKMSWDPDPGVRCQAIKILGGFQRQEALSRMKDSILDSSENVQAEAFKVLAQWEGPEFTETLVNFASDPSTTVRRAVAQCLETRTTPELIPILEKLSEDDGSAAIRRSTVHCLEAIPGEESERLLVCLMHDPSSIVAKAAEKVLKKRAKAEFVDPSTTFELRFGRKQAVATRLAFHGRSSQPLKAWQAFLAGVHRLDGKDEGNSTTSPSILVETPLGSHYCLMPFGPAHWMRIEHAPQLKGAPRMAYAVLGTEEVRTWSEGISVKRFHQGRSLSKRLGWFEAQPIAEPS